MLAFKKVSQKFCPEIFKPYSYISYHLAEGIESSKFNFYPFFQCYLMTTKLASWDDSSLGSVVIINALDW